MRELLLVGVGGFVGAIARYLLSVAVGARVTDNFPWGTLSVNLVGCLVIGVLIALAEARGILGAEARLVLFTGVIGSFTTFSTFCFEGVELFRAGSLALGLGYVGTSVGLGLACVWLGRAGVSALL